MIVIQLLFSHIQLNRSSDVLFIRELKLYIYFMTKDKKKRHLKEIY
jgi:hypothetical protein